METQPRDETRWKEVPRTAAGEAALEDPDFYINRELSLLAFHRRVLDQAKDERIPLLERLRFLTISSTNLDEFFEVRVSGLKQQIAYGVTKRGPDGLKPAEALVQIASAAHELVVEQYRILNEELLPALQLEGIRLLKRADWSPEQQRWIRATFLADVLPILTPISLDPVHPFPMVLNKGLSFIVPMVGQDAFGRSSGTAVLQVPRSLPRVIQLPLEIAAGSYDFVLLSSVIHAHADDLFPGMETSGCYQFRVTRNSDLWVDEEETEDLLEAIKGELPSRNYGDPVRLEVAENITPQMSNYLLERTRLQQDDLYRVNGPVNLGRLAALYDLVDRPELKYERFDQRTPQVLKDEPSVFEALRRGDVLLHHPFDSFWPVVELVRQAATDPHVVAIKQTLYRTGGESPLVDALIDAARSGKEVTVVIELRARFDEEANIDLATRLQAVGANVVYGIVGYKCHGKMLLVFRRERGRISRYVHLGTGNYHTKTTRAYTDFGLMTCDPVIGEDVQKLFLQLTGMGRVPELGKLLQSPFTMQERLLELIDEEAERARRGEPARIVAKMNSLNDPVMIRALYGASRAGVEIELIVRGICCLRPGVPGLSETICVRSVVGRFLEHTRVFYFLAGGRELVYCASADWMPRNLYRRVEVGFPVEDPELKVRLLREGLDAYLADDCFSWFLSPDGTYSRRGPDGDCDRHVQDTLLEELNR